MSKLVAVALILAGAYLIDAHWYRGMYCRAATSVAAQIWTFVVR